MACGCVASPLRMRQLRHCGRSSTAAWGAAATSHDGWGGMMDTHTRPRGVESSDRTGRAVGLQVASMACERYELGVWPSEADVLIHVAAGPGDVERRVPWLKHKNAD